MKWGKDPPSNIFRYKIYRYVYINLITLNMYILIQHSPIALKLHTPITDSITFPSYVIFRKHEWFRHIGESFIKEVIIVCAGVVALR